MDESVFAAQMQGMATVLKGRKATDADWTTVMEIYWSMFQRWPNERFLAAVSRCVATSPFFPAPSDLIETGRLHPVADKPVQVRELLDYGPDRLYSPEDDAAREEAMAEFRKFVASAK